MNSAPAALRKILVIDDNRDGAEMIAAVLDILGHRTAIAYDGHSGLVLARQFVPELVLLDIGMPGLDGYQVAALLRQEWGNRLRIVAVSAWSDPRSIERMQAAGFDTHLTKPAAIEALAAVIDDSDAPSAWRAVSR